MGSADASGYLDPARLDQLLRRYGIAGEFIEFSGNVARIPLANRLHILRTMGVMLDSPEQLEGLLRVRELSDYDPWLPQVLVLAEGATTVTVSVLAKDSDQPLRWQVRCEDPAREVLRGTVVPAQLPLLSRHDVAGRLYERRQLSLPSLPTGYHRLVLDAGLAQLDGLLIVAPSHAWQPESLRRGEPLWGLSTQLYSLRSASNWGVGDFRDLEQLVTLAAAEGAHFVLVNPMHALDLRYPENASPYSPSDRRFLNPLYIALPCCEDFAAATVQAQVAAPKHLRMLAALRAAALVDYTGVSQLKFKVLTLMYRHFQQQLEVAPSSARVRRFRQFVREGGTALHDFAALQAQHNATDGAALTEPGFHEYLQWLAQEQLQACQDKAKALGMPLGLIRDLAVGSSVDGCEVQGSPGLFCSTARIGAPPDYFNPEGQNWGLPPLHPEALKADEFRHFIALLRANMRACGALRIDHVMSLMRLWWCPDDGSNAAGAYVHYPVDVLFAILRLESCRNRCLVIGEDLGVVPPEIRSYLDNADIYSNCVFYFEKYDGWHFRKPEHYKAQSLAMIANHDVPPLCSWWQGNDLALRHDIGLIPDMEHLQAAREYRRGEKGQILQWLAEQQLLPASWHDRDLERPLDAALSTALVRACGQVASRLLSLQVDDLAAVDMPVNIPGTCDEYPNWRRKIPVALEDVFANTVARGLLQALRETRTA